jgi:hypothetical protein
MLGLNGWSKYKERLQKEVAMGLNTSGGKAYYTPFNASTQGGEVGFPPDLVDARSPPHLVAILSSLWALPSHMKVNYCGGGALSRSTLLPT